MKSSKDIHTYNATQRVEFHYSCFTYKRYSNIRINIDRAIFIPLGWIEKTLHPRCG